ncbi:124aa long hypothetical protein [Pyrococcus horikoshii OT3]|uniref:Uncharacterized protein n=1 Tax=Pyrococcus horikoshii (strain ATCC 700860 / DSM 12428 / JCM 9974 / NBRC 100139 / OT-3) TaxID=70601 RepID=O59373_PYRHO|nr:124aa long hypothetical protein [Pyrococcus horikoshii OT3]
MNFSLILFAYSGGSISSISLKTFLTISLFSSDILLITFSIYVSTNILTSSNSLFSSINSFILSSSSCKNSASSFILISIGSTDFISSLACSYSGLFLISLGSYISEPKRVGVRSISNLNPLLII